MSTFPDITPSFLQPVAVSGLPDRLVVPAIVAYAGDHAAGRFVEFFTATITNPNTREAYGRSVGAFLAWCEGQGLAFAASGRSSSPAMSKRCWLAAWRSPPSNNIWPLSA